MGGSVIIEAGVAIPSASESTSVGKKMRGYGRSLGGRGRGVGGGCGYGNHRRRRTVGEGDPPVLNFHRGSIILFFHRLVFLLTF